MIHEIDEALEAFVRRDALDGAGAEVVFDPPTKEWAARRNTPTVDVYLYDIREDTRRRSVGSYSDRDEAGVLRAQTEPPRYFRLSYLITAWTQRPEDEHRLLSALLAMFIGHRIIPPELLIGSLADIGLPVMMEVAKPPPENRQISEVWTALGGELKASLEVIVTAAMTSAPVPVGALPASGGVAIDMFGGPGQDDHAVTRPPLPPQEDEAADPVRAGG